MVKGSKKNYKHWKDKEVYRYSVRGCLGGCKPIREFWKGPRCTLVTLKNSIDGCVVKG
jgi:hypothetical protein